jgi:hypothetical protein
LWQQYQYAWDREDRKSVVKLHFTKGDAERFSTTQGVVSTARVGAQKNQGVDEYFFGEKYTALSGQYCCENHAPKVSTVCMQ